jgi:hypothetical protein
LAFWKKPTTHFNKKYRKYMIKQPIKAIANQLLFGLCTRYAQSLFITICFSCLYNKKTASIFFREAFNCAD